MRNRRTIGFSIHAALAVLLGSTVAALADREIAPPGGTNINNEGKTPRRWAQPNDRMAGPQVGERLIDLLLANTKLTTEIGLSPETVASLRGESHAIQAQHNEIETQIRKLSLEQANRMSRLLQASDANTNEMMKTVEEIGRLRTEQAKLAIQNLMVIRQHLTPDQIRRARELMRELQKDGDVHPGKKEGKEGPVPFAGPPPPKPPEGF